MVPIAVVLHMPLGYTSMFAERLNALSDLRVEEAQQGTVLKAGTALIAPGGRHLTFERAASGNVVTRLGIRPVDKPHRPSVDVMFQSAAEVFGSRTMAVVMTGMGDDGRIGATCIKGAGGVVLTEAKESCVVYGMPREVAEAGLSDGAYPLGGLAEAIIGGI